MQDSVLHIAVRIYLSRYVFNMPNGLQMSAFCAQNEACRMNLSDKFKCGICGPPQDFGKKVEYMATLNRQWVKWHTARKQCVIQKDTTYNQNFAIVMITRKYNKV